MTRLRKFPLVPGRAYRVRDLRAIERICVWDGTRFEHRKAGRVVPLDLDAVGAVQETYTREPRHWYPLDECYNQQPKAATSADGAPRATAYTTNPLSMEQQR